MDKKRSLNVAIYSPYMDILGGGEKYLLTISQALKKENEIVLYSSQFDQTIISKRFQIDLDGIQVKSDSLFRKTLSLNKLITLLKYDLLFYMTDGSVFFSPVKKNYLIIQSPLHIPALTKITSLKLHNWKIICYSKFMQEIIAQRISQKAFILSPAIDVKVFNCSHANKKNIILSVGRFFSFPHNKNQSVLLDIFIQNYQKKFNDWKLVLIGATADSEGSKNVDQLKRLAKGYPVEIIPNASFDTLLNYYHASKIYWHAAGYGSDLNSHPESAEHFGIVVLEAMAAGLVPIVFRGGGLKDIVNDHLNGYQWSAVEELVDITNNLITDENLLLKTSRQSVKRANEFSLNRFYENLKTIID